jgi:hypothetical protein
LANFAGFAALKKVWHCLKSRQLVLARSAAQPRFDQRVVTRESATAGFAAPGIGRGLLRFIAGDEEDCGTAKQSAISLRTLFALFQTHLRFLSGLAHSSRHSVRVWSGMARERSCADALGEPSGLFLSDAR